MSCRVTPCPFKICCDFILLEEFTLAKHNIVSRRSPTEWSSKVGSMLECIVSSPIGRNCRARLAVGTFTLVPVADGAAICFICSEPEFRPLGMVRMCVGFDGANE